MQHYKVTGMSCAACSSRGEKAVSAVKGVDSCAVSLLTNSMGVEGNASPKEILQAVEKAGYGASLEEPIKEKTYKKTGEGKVENSGDELEDLETPVLRKRLLLSLIFLVPLMYESMGHMLWNWPLPNFLDGNHVGMALYEMLLAAIVMIINQKFFISGFKGLIRKAPNMDTLVALGATAAFGYSVVALFAMSKAMSAGDMEAAGGFMQELYFESAATILTLITVGKTLEAKSKGRTTNALRELMKLAPKRAVVLKGESEVEVPIEEVNIGDLIVVRPGENIPVDAVVIKGNSAVNEAALTGESLPVDKAEGDNVSAATLNQSGHLVCRATGVGEDTTLSQIIRMISDAAATKAPIAKIADKVSGIFVPVVISIAAATFIIWLLAGETVAFALARAISVLVISCPCALGLATPVAIMVGSGKGAKNGILFKTAASLEATGRIQVVALDKTGTITKGEPQVKKISTVADVTEEELLSVAYALEQKSEHPLAHAIVIEALARGISKETVTDFKAEIGSGVTGYLGGRKLLGGSQKFVTESLGIEFENTEAEEMATFGMTPLFFAADGKLLGIIGVADVIKEDSAAAIKKLKDMGLRVVMITGDNLKTAEAIGREAGVNQVVAGVLPDGKEAAVVELQKFGSVAMVGDGINDAPALTRADVGMAIGAGTDVAIDAAQVVLMKNSLEDVVAAIRLGRATLKNIHENLFWAFFYNIIGIPLAAGVWINIFGWTLNPTFAAAAMGLSSFCVVTNALRLNLFKMYESKLYGNTEKLEELKIAGVDGKIYIERKEREDKKMEIKVKGMMCHHCEAHVKNAIEAIDGVVEVKANHNTDTVEIRSDKDIDIAEVKAAVINAGYEFAE